jgi:hypothetical protein
MSILLIAACGSLGLSSANDKMDTGSFGGADEIEEDADDSGDSGSADEGNGGSGGESEEGSEEPPERDTGTPAETTAPLEGESYAILPDQLNFTEPPGVGALLSAYLDASLILYVDNETSTSLGFSVTLGTVNGDQDACERILALPTASWVDPTFQVGPTDFTTTIGGEVMTLFDLEISGEFAADGSEWRDGVVSAVLDGREVDTALPSGLTMCDLVASAGGACVGCDDGSVTCAVLRAESVMGVRRGDAFDPTPDTSGC